MFTIKSLRFLMTSYFGSDLIKEIFSFIYLLKNSENCLFLKICFFFEGYFVFEGFLKNVIKIHIKY